MFRFLRSSYEKVECRDFWQSMLQFSWEFIQQSGKRLFIMTFCWSGRGRRKHEDNILMFLGNGSYNLYGIITEQEERVWICSCVCLFLIELLWFRIFICFHSLWFVHSFCLLLTISQKGDRLSWDIKHTWAWSDITYAMVIWAAAPDLCNRFRTSKCWTPPPHHHLTGRICRLQEQSDMTLHGYIQT